MKSQVDFYSDIKMGNWAFPIHIGCFNFSWSLYCDSYEYDKPTDYGCELSDSRLWLIEHNVDTDRFVIFDKLDGNYRGVKNEINALFAPVAKNRCMDLYNRVMRHAEFGTIIIGATDDVYYSVYHDVNGEKRRQLSFASREQADLYRDFLVRIPFSRFMTNDNMKIEEMRLNRA